MPKRVNNAKIACLDMGLMKSKMKMGVQVVVTDPAQLEAIHKRYFALLYAHTRLLSNYQFVLLWRIIATDRYCYCDR